MFVGYYLMLLLNKVFGIKCNNKISYNYFELDYR